MDGGGADGADRHRRGGRRPWAAAALDAETPTVELRRRPRPAAPSRSASSTRRPASAPRRTRPSSARPWARSRRPTPRAASTASGRSRSSPRTTAPTSPRLRRPSRSSSSRTRSTSSCSRGWTSSPRWRAAIEEKAGMPGVLSYHPAKGDTGTYKWTFSNAQGAEDNADALVKVFAAAGLEDGRRRRRRPHDPAGDARLLRRDGSGPGHHVHQDEGPVAARPDRLQRRRLQDRRRLRRAPTPTRWPS